MTPKNGYIFDDFGAGSMNSFRSSLVGGLGNMGWELRMKIFACFAPPLISKIYCQLQVVFRTLGETQIWRSIPVPHAERVGGLRMSGIIVGAVLGRGVPNSSHGHLLEAFLCIVRISLAALGRH